MVVRFPSEALFHLQKQREKIDLYRLFVWYGAILIGPYVRIDLNKAIHNLIDVDLSQVSFVAIDNGYHLILDDYMQFLVTGISKLEKALF